MTDTKFKPGRSGNPGGRPPGAKNKKTLVALALDASSEDVARRVVQEALLGDMTAAKLVLDRVAPPLRAEGPRVQFHLDPNAPLAAQGQQIIFAVSKGDMDVDTAQVLINCLVSFAGLREHDELAKRITELEQNALAAATAGQVLGKVMQTAAEAS